MPNDERPFAYYDFLGCVIDCMEIAGQRRPGRFDCRRAALYTGLQCEELAEKLLRLGAAPSSKAHSSAVMHLGMALDLLGGRFKAGEFDNLLQHADHDKLIDDDFDLAWVSLGALEATAVDASGALAHGIESNLAKFPNGKATLDANGKFMKPPGWKKPDFTPFCDPTRGID